MGIRQSVGARVARSRQAKIAKRLQTEYEELGADAWWPPLPPPVINFNQVLGGDLHSYREDYLRGARRALLALRGLADLQPSSCTLDFGCGLGRLAAAYAEDGHVGSYLGWEPEHRALDWLQRAYAQSPNFRFSGVELPKELNYVTHGEGAFRGSDGHGGAAPPLEALLELVDGATLTLCFTHSVFTHIWPSDMASTLLVINEIGDRETVYVDTHLVVDDVAEHAMQDGRADRRLNLTIDGVRTYSSQNPLVCTAYELSSLESIYRRSGREIVDIQFGSWAGRGNDLTYQDVVVSRLHRS